jgi:hypothetical protein
MDKQEIKKSNPEEKKILIETSSDLYKLPLDIIKNTKIYNFKGNYFDELYEEALKIEKAGGLEKFSISNYLKKGIKIEKIKFQMTYQTQMGQELGVIGSIKELGEWNQDKALKMEWTNGNVWIKKVDYNENIDFEFKFIFIVNMRVEKWEDGNNRKFNFNEIKNKIENEKNNSDVVNININQQIYKFDSNENLLTIIAQWNKK